MTLQLALDFERRDWPMSLIPETGNDWHDDCRRMVLRTFRESNVQRRIIVSLKLRRHPKAAAYPRYFDTALGDGGIFPPFGLPCAFRIAKRPQIIGKTWREITYSDVRKAEKPLAKRRRRSSSKA